MSERKGEWIQTASGGKFWSLDPQSEDIKIVDIACALSKICRFGGHCKEFYSVAQHSCLVSDNCKFPLYGLLHDASEAYMMDLPRPIKISLREQGITIFDEIEKKILSKVWVKFELPLPNDDVCQNIAEVDTILLTTEARDLMSPLAEGWKVTAENGYEVLEDRILPWSCETAFREFMSRFDHLFEIREDEYE